MYRSLLLLVYLLCPAYSHAQQRLISGRVTDERGQPLPGVNIAVRGSERGNSTDEEGRYSLRASQGETLAFSFIGYQPTTVAVGSEASIDVQLHLIRSGLREVVYTGYRKESSLAFTGAASTVKAEDIEKTPNPNIGQNLQGSVAGISVMSGSGQPGTQPDIRIRGSHSVSGVNTPLLVIDGTPASSSFFNTLEPGDIKSITVLKDALSLAPYGSRGTNGVIVITTRSGKSGVTTAKLTSECGWSEMGNAKFDMMNTQELLAFQKRVGKGAGASLAKDPKALESLRNTDVDWKKIFFRTGTRQRHSFSLSGGLKNTAFRSSLSFLNQEGIIQNSSYRKVNGLIKVDHKINDFMQAGTHVDIAYERSNVPTRSGGVYLRNPFFAVYTAQTYQKPYREGDSINTGENHIGPNALDALIHTKYEQQGLIGFGSAHLKVDFTDWLYFQVKGSVTHEGYDDQKFYKPDSYSGKTLHGGQGGLVYRRAYYTDLQGNTELSFERKFSTDHQLKVAAFTEYLYQKYKKASLVGYGLNPKLGNSLTGISKGTATNGFIPNTTGEETEAKLFSYFLLGDYSYRKRYKLSGSLRRDNASRFAPSKRWATFWSVGGTWQLSNEAFLSDVQWIDNLKLRISYGTTGNMKNISRYGHLATYTTPSYQGEQGLQIQNPGNPQLTWELSHKANIGFDFSLLQDRVSGTLNVYNEEVVNLFVDYKLSQTSGFSSIKANEGKLINRGIEFDFQTDLLKNQTLQWSIQGNIAYNRNRVADLGQVNRFEQGTGIIEEGLPLGSHFAVKWAGVDPETGSPMYYDLKGEKTKVYSPADKVAEFGTCEAPTSGGFGTRLDYKKLYLQARFTYSIGFSRYNNQTFFIENPQFAAHNLSRRMLSMWKKKGDKTDIQSYTYPLAFSSKFIEDASFIRFRALTIGWAVSGAWLKSIRPLTGIDLYASVQNLYTWTRWTGFDPEDNNNIAQFEYPTPRNFNLGMHFTF